MLSSSKRSISFKDLTSKAASVGGTEWEKRSEKMERELLKLRENSTKRIAKIQEKWNDAKVVSLRDKLSFLFGVMVGPSFRILNLC